MSSRPFSYCVGRMSGLVPHHAVMGFQTFGDRLVVTPHAGHSIRMVARALLEVRLL